MKKMITLICCVLSAMLLLTGCAQAQLTSEQETLVKDNVKSIVNIIVANVPADGAAWVAYSEADRNAQLGISDDLWEETQDNWKENNKLNIDKKSTYVKGIESYLSAEEENGVPTSVNETLEYAIVDNNLAVTATLVTPVRNVEMVVLYDDTDMTVIGISFNPVYTVAENMLRATLNTLMGMGVVFAVLILISLIISCFGFIPKIQAAFSKKKENKEQKEEPVDQTIAQIIEKEELSDDLELVAVISAAIAAYEGSSSTEGFVVRSIKKQKKDGWKRAY
ncbi:MAG: OadG family protein [Lachnospiraceae bacterium]|nr:OadG family protein [Lachnospiraceae bacterium]